MAFQFGSYTPYAFSPKFDRETFFVHGSMGKASAMLEVHPKIVGRLQCASHLITLEQAPSTRRDTIVMAVTYPFSLVTYDAVLHILAQREFKLKVQGGSGLEMHLTFAPDMIVLGGVLSRARQMLSPPRTRRALPRLASHTSRVRRRRHRVLSSTHELCGMTT